MRAPASLIAITAALALATSARALAAGTEWELDLDARLVSSDGKRSVLDGGLGELRYGSNQSGLQLGRLRLALSQPIGDVLAVHLDASSWGGQDKNPLDLTEAYVEYRPYPVAGFKARVRAGAFYAPISLENRSAGWDTPYTLSSSAINTWIAEELRTIGVETQVDWLGTRLGHAFDVAVVGGVYGWNDPAGGVIAAHGFALHDQQTTLFGRVGRPGVEPLNGRELFHEIDGRAGVYAGVELRYFDRLTLRALRYDNRANPAAYDESLEDYAWLTTFNSAGARFETANGWTVISQWLQGRTVVAPVGFHGVWPFNARFLLVSRRIGKQSFTVRYDDFAIGFDANGVPVGDQNGHAWTFAYVSELTPSWRVTVEVLRADTNLIGRSLYLDAPPGASETGVQLALRYAVGPGVR